MRERGVVISTAQAFLVKKYELIHKFKRVETVIQVFLPAVNAKTPTPIALGLGSWR